MNFGLGTSICGPIMDWFAKEDGSVIKATHAKACRKLSLQYNIYKYCCVCVCPCLSIRRGFPINWIEFCWIVLFGAILWTRDNTLFVRFQTKANQIVEMHRNHNLSWWIKHDRNANMLENAAEETQTPQHDRKNIHWHNDEHYMLKMQPCPSFQFKTAKVLQSKTAIPRAISCWKQQLRKK